MKGWEKKDRYDEKNSENKNNSVDLVQKVKAKDSELHQLINEMSKELMRITEAENTYRSQLVKKNYEIDVMKNQINNLIEQTKKLKDKLPNQKSSGFSIFNIFGDKKQKQAPNKSADNKVFINDDCEKAKLMGQSEMNKINEELKNKLAQVENLLKQEQRKNQQKTKQNQDLKQKINALEKQKYEQRGNLKPRRQTVLKDMQQKLQRNKYPQRCQTSKKEEVKSNYQQKIIQNVTQKQLIRLLELYTEFPKVKRIYLENCRITNKGLKTLAENCFKFPFLQQINLDKNNITDEGFKAFAENGSEFLNLQKIYFRKNQITDRGLQVLVENASKFPNVSSIYLEQNQITNAGLKVVVKNYASFPNHPFFILQSNYITSQEKKKIKNYHLIL